MSPVFRVRLGTRKVFKHILMPWESKIKPNLVLQYTDDDLELICDFCGWRFGLHYPKSTLGISGCPHEEYPSMYEPKQKRYSNDF